MVSVMTPAPIGPPSREPVWAEIKWPAGVHYDPVQHTIVWDSNGEPIELLIRTPDGLDRTYKVSSTAPK